MKIHFSWIEILFDTVKFDNSSKVGIIKFDPDPWYPCDTPHPWSQALDHSPLDCHTLDLMGAHFSHEEIKLPQGEK